MIEPPLESNEIQLTKEYRISVDRYNISLTKRHEKREGKGKNAPLSGTYDYNRANALHFGSPKMLGQKLIQQEFMNNLSQQDLSKVNDLVLAIQEAVKHIDSIAVEVGKMLEEKVVIQPLESKRGKKKSDDEGDEE